MISRLALAIVLAIPTLAYSQAPDPCQQSPQTCATLIYTHATSRTRVPNTSVDISVSIAFSDKDLPTVQRTIGTKSDALLRYLRSQNVQRLITTNVSFRPDTKYENNGPNKIVGFEGSLNISFRTNPEKAPDVLTGALSNGANSLSRTNFTPTEDEIAAARSQLSADATKIAMAQAESIATAAGMHVVSIREITVDNAISSNQQNGYATYNYAGGGGGLFDKRKTAALPPATETEAGEDSLAITVNLVAAAIH